MLDLLILDGDYNFGVACSLDDFSPFTGATIRF